MSEKYRGLKGVDITTGSHIFNPEQSFHLAHELKEAGHDVQIEVYPTLDRRVIRHIRALGNKLGISLPIPPGVTEEDVRRWQDKYPNAKVNRVHLPFSYNNTELWWLVVDPKTEPKARIHHLAWIFFIGAAQNLKGVSLAQKLADQNVGLTMHANAVAGFAKTGTLEGIKKKVSFILAENGMPYRSPVLKNVDAISDPRTIAQQIITRYGLTGMLLGIDHLIAQDARIEDILSDRLVVDVVHAMHLANPAHGEIGPGDESYKHVLKKIAQTEFKTPVRAALDYAPLNTPFQEEVMRVGRTIDWIMETQK